MDNILNGHVAKYNLKVRKNQEWIMNCSPKIKRRICDKLTDKNPLSPFSVYLQAVRRTALLRG